jgi:hypothetical protein
LKPGAFKLCFKKTEIQLVQPHLGDLPHGAEVVDRVPPRHTGCFNRAADPAAAAAAVSRRRVHRESGAQVIRRRRVIAHHADRLRFLACEPTQASRRRRVVALQVEFERQILKPGFHLIGFRL